MIKLEHVVLASPEQMEFIIEGMRNSTNSWKKSDSQVCNYMFKGCCGSCEKENNGCRVDSEENDFYLGGNDYILMQKLAASSTDHRKFMSMMPVYVKITAPLYWWYEFDTRMIGIVPAFYDTMRNIAEKEFTLEDFSCEHLTDCRWLAMFAPTEYRFSSIDLLKLEIDVLNQYRDKYIKMIDDAGSYKGMRKKDIWWQMIQLLPSSYNQTRNVTMNYEVLANIYRSYYCRRYGEWIEFCRWIEDLPYSELIMSAAGLDDNSINAKQGLARNRKKED